MLNTRIVSWSLGLSTAISFVLCVNRKRIRIADINGPASSGPIPLFERRYQ
jgi:hypothetical protein